MRAMFAAFVLVAGAAIDYPERCIMPDGIERPRPPRHRRRAAVRLRPARPPPVAVVQQTGPKL